MRPNPACIWLLYRFDLFVLQTLKMTLRATKRLMLQQRIMMGFVKNKKQPDREGVLE